MEIEDMNGNGTTTGTADSGGNGNGRTGRKLNSAAVAKLRQSKFRSDKSNSTVDTGSKDVGHVNGVESGTSGGTGVIVDSDNQRTAIDFDQSDRRIDNPVDNGIGSRSAIEYTTGRTGERRPRPIEFDDDTTADVAVKPKTVTTRGTRKQTVDADTASIVIQLLFGVLAITLGDHWKQTDEAILAAAEPLSRILSRLPKTKTQFLNTYLDPILFGYALICMCSTPMKIELERAKRKSIPARKVPNVVPVNSQTVATTTSDGNNGYHADQSFFNGF